MKSLKVYPTRIEIEPYEAGEWENVEKECSRDYDPQTHKRDPIGYMIEDGVLTIHRGNNITRIAQLAGRPPAFMNNQLVSNMRYRYQMTTSPRNQLQKDAIDFLTLRGQYATGKRIYSQYALVLKPGSGKTYCTIAAMLQLGVRTIVILHQDKIKEQWLKTLREKTNVRMSRVITITGGEMMDKMQEEPPDFDIAFILHSSIISYISSRGTEKTRAFFSSLQCGIKVVDEVHLYFKDTIMVDFLTDIPKSIYLTATFTRSDFRETRLFQNVFSSTLKFFQKDRIKNVIYEFILYNSNPTHVEQAAIETYWGFSSAKYGDYSFKKDPYKTIIQVYLFALERALEHTGKVMVLVPKIENCETLYEITKHLYPGKEIGTIHSKNSKEHNERVKEEAEIIISRVGSLGTGTDIALIRSVILMEPYSSPVTAEQVIGRLRPYYDEDSYLYELVNVGFFKVLNMLKRRYKTIKSVCKEIRTVRYENQ